MKKPKATMTRITQFLDADAAAAVEFRECRKCGRIIDHADDHAPGCRCKQTRPRRVNPGDTPDECTNMAWCKRLAKSIGAKAVARREDDLCWVERRLI